MEVKRSGRGRGRGVPIFTKDSKPGGLSAIDELSSIVHSLTLDADDTERRPVIDTTMKLATSPQNQEKIRDILYDRCMKDWRFCAQTVDVCNEIQHIQTDDVKFRSLLLSMLQGDVKNKENLRVSNPDRCLGCISLLCQLLHRGRDGNGERLSMLLRPALDCLHMLLDDQAVEQELRCAAAQLSDLAAFISTTAPADNITQLTDCLKARILTGRADPETLLCLLHLYEGFVSDWKITYNANMT